MSSIWVYPGQGAQQVNMLHDLPEHRLVQHYEPYRVCRRRMASRISGKDRLIFVIKR